MSDQQTPAPETLETPAETAPATPPVGVGLVTDGAYYLVAGQFATLEQTQAAYATLEQIEATTSLRIDAVIIASADDKGNIKLHQATDHATKTGLKWGVVGGVVLGVIFPPSILAGAVGMGVVGSALGKIRNIGHRSQISRRAPGCHRSGHERPARARRGHRGGGDPEGARRGGSHRVDRGGQAGRAGDRPRGRCCQGRARRGLIVGARVPGTRQRSVNIAFRGPHPLDSGAGRRCTVRG